MKKKKIFSLLLACAMMVSLAACGGGGGGGENDGSGDNGDSGGSGGSGGASTISVSIASEPDSIDPALNTTVDGATMLVHLFAGLAKWEPDSEGNLSVVADCAEELVDGVTNEDGSVTYTYTLKEGLTWSDGQPVTAADFAYAWQRAASTDLVADYNYMFECIDGFAEMWETDDSGQYVNPDAKLSVEATDDRTLVVTLSNLVPYWEQLLAFPTYFPVREDVVSNEGWATDPSTYVCNGPYTLSDWQHNLVINMQKNPSYHNADSILMEEINFYLSDDSNNMLTNFKDGSWLLIDDVPTNEIPALKNDYPDEFVAAPVVGTYYSNWNVNVNLLPESSSLSGAEAEAAQAEIRQAISLLLDRNYIVEQIAQGGQIPASSFVPMGMTNPDGSEFYETAGHNDGYVGYYQVSPESTESNYNTAIEILKKYYSFDEGTQTFTDFPSLTYLYNTSEGHKAIGEYIQSALAGVGITVNMQNQEWNTFVNTRKSGDFSIARNGWYADYRDPICFLDMWISGSGNNDVQFGKGDHANLAMYDLDLTPYGYDINVQDGTWAQTYDVLISTIKTCTDENTRFELMHLAEDILMSTGCLIPIYYQTDLYMLNQSVSGFFCNPLGYKYFMYCTVS